MALIETNFIRPQEVYDRNTGESKVRYRSYDGNDRFIPVVEGEKGVPKTMVEVTHAELKAMRDGGKLTAGSLYRITDYNCTTTQENTQSAGHQFDIVLLALSANKLTEEGWAMEHPTDVYDVTFTDGVTKKCYLYYEETSELYNLVDIETLLGVQMDLNSAIEGGAINIDHQNKTILISPEAEATSDILAEANLTYNYFQNSNLSAWKVWYCLDNDKSRFAWADDSVDEGSPAIINGTFVRDSTKDMGGKYAWWYAGSNPLIIDNPIFTDSDIPEIGDSTYIYGKDFVTYSIVKSFTPAHEGTGLPNGHGVIYRLIDEWNNDCPCDFKNILYLRKVTNGEIDAQGTDTYIPTFCLYDIGNDEYKDASIFAIEYLDDEGKTRPCNNIFIGSILAIDRSIDSGIYALPQNIILAKVEKDDTGWSSRDVTLVNVFMCNFTNSTSHVIYLSSSNKTYVGDNNTIISQGKRVVWENIS